MIDDIFEKRRKRKVADLNIVPILDMLTTVIFFLLLSTSFLEFVKLTVPPSAVSSVAVAPGGPPPVTPKLLLVDWRDKLKLVLTWSGEQGGETSDIVDAADPKERRRLLVEKSSKLTQDFVKTHPKEKTLQLGLGAKVAFQNLISVMDGVRGALPDIVLISYAEAEARVAATNGGSP